MNRFLAKSILFVCLVGASIYLVFTRADGYTDPFYIRFTTPRQNNLIIGTSRAAQGIQPKIFKEIMGKSIFNYSFTDLHSPFGPTYFKSIIRKLDPATTDGIFIIAIDPWSISSRSKNPDDPSKFREADLCLGNTKIVDLNPNPFYLMNNTDGKYYKILQKKPSSTFLHDDGWLEVSVRMDSASVEKRIEIKVKSYREKKVSKCRFSSVRMEYLIKTIEYLKNHGSVYMVRLPVHPKMMEIDNLLMPDFEIKIEKAKKMVSGYLDLTGRNSDYTYTDGNHLYKESGQEVTRIIAEWINVDQNRILKTKRTPAAMKFNLSFCRFFCLRDSF